MITPLLAEVWGLSLAGLAIRIIIVVGILAILYIVLTKVAGIQIPPYVIQIFWIVVAITIAVFAIAFLASLG